jgi:hypothetical protein
MCHVSLLCLLLRSSVTLFAQKQQLTAMQSALHLRQPLLHVCSAGVRDISNDTEPLLPSCCWQQQTPWSTDLLKNVSVAQLVTKFPAFPRAHILFLLSQEPNIAVYHHTTEFRTLPSHFTSLYYFLILSSHICPRTQNSLLPSCFVAIYFSSPLMHATFTTLIILFSIIVLIIFDAYKHCYLLHGLVLFKYSITIIIIIITYVSSCTFAAFVTDH